jgi:hypothetical protein
MQNSRPSRRTTAAILIHDNATEAASRRSARWATLVVCAVVAWIWLGQASPHSFLFVVTAITTLGAANSASEWYRMRRYAAARFAKYRANPSTHIV